MGRQFLRGKASTAASSVRRHQVGNFDVAGAGCDVHGGYKGGFVMSSFNEPGIRVSDQKPL